MEKKIDQSYCVFLFPKSLYLQAPQNKEPDEKLIYSTGGPRILYLKILFSLLNLKKFNFVIDGNYCDGFFEAVKMFQELQGIEVDGNCGPATRERLSKVIGVDLSMIPRKIIFGNDVAVQPDGKAISSETMNGFIRIFLLDSSSIIDSIESEI